MVRLKLLLTSWKMPKVHSRLAVLRAVQHSAVQHSVEQDAAQAAAQAA